MCIRDSTYQAYKLLNNNIHKQRKINFLKVESDYTVNLLEYDNIEKVALAKNDCFAELLYPTSFTPTRWGGECKTCKPILKDPCDENSEAIYLYEYEKVACDECEQYTNNNIWEKAKKVPIGTDMCYWKECPPLYSSYNGTLSVNKQGFALVITLSDIKEESIQIPDIVEIWNYLESSVKVKLYEEMAVENRLYRGLSNDIKVERLAYMRAAKRKINFNYVTPSTASQMISVPKILKSFSKPQLQLDTTSSTAFDYFRKD